MGLFKKKKCMYCGGKVGLLGGNGLKDTDEVMCNKCCEEKVGHFIFSSFLTKEEFEEQSKKFEKIKELRASFEETDTINYSKKRTILSFDADKRLFIFPQDHRMEEYDVFSFDDVKDFRMEYNYDMFTEQEFRRFKKKFDVPFDDMPLPDPDSRVMTVQFVIELNKDCYIGKDDISFDIAYTEEISKGYEIAGALYDVFMQYTGIVKKKFGE